MAEFLLHRVFAGAQAEGGAVEEAFRASASAIACLCRNSVFVSDPSDRLPKCPHGLLSEPSRPSFGIHPGVYRFSGRDMKAFMLFTGSGPIVILTTHASVLDPALVEKLAGKGIEKFVAYEIPIDLARTRYGGHFSVVENDLRETDDLRVLDYDGSRAFKLFRVDELGEPVVQEPVSTIG
jgi:hypothetical protein